MMKVLLFILFIFSLGVSVYARSFSHVPLIPGKEYGILISSGNNFRASANTITYTTEDLTDKNLNNGYLNGKESGELIYLYLYLDVYAFEAYYSGLSLNHASVQLNMRLTATVTNAHGEACSSSFNVNLWDTSNTHDLIVQLRTEPYNFYNQWYSYTCNKPTDITKIKYGPLFSDLYNNDYSHMIWKNGRPYFFFWIGTYRIITNPYNNSHNPPSVLKGKSPYKATVQFSVQQIPPYY